MKIATPRPLMSLPELITTGAAIRAATARERAARRVVGLAPTMGALHQGHLSLVRAAREECDTVITSIFVNPTQFAEGEDLDRYPRDLQRDLELLATAGCDMVFAPPVEEIYPPGSDTFVEVGAAAAEWEGAFRPTHFRGVTTVVLKLFNLAPAHKAYFGQKDYQQSVVVRQMAADLHLPIEIVVCPIVREPDGLAMSSRNAYLSPAEREQALSLSQGLQLASQLVEQGQREAGAIRSALLDLLKRAGAEAQYVALLKPGTMQPAAAIDGPTVVAVAAKVGQTRLIDNALIG